MFIDKFIEKHNLIYLPIGASIPEKKTIITIAIWFGMAFIFSCYFASNISQHIYIRWVFYLMGMLPMFYAFQDKVFVETNVRKEFSSLMAAIYKGNIFYMLIMVFSVLCYYEEVWEIVIICGCFVIFWLLSIPLIVCYEIRERIIYGIFCFLISTIFVFFVQSTEGYNNIILIAIIAMLLISVATSLIISYKQINKTFGLDEKYISNKKQNKTKFQSKYIPIGAAALERKTKIAFVICFIIACLVSYFGVSNISTGSRGRVLFYVIGILPTIYAFQDKNYVQNNLRKNFSSLMTALYKWNIIWILIMLAFSLGLYGEIWDNLAGSVCFAVFWILSIPLIVFYEIKQWITYGSFCIAVNFIFIFFIYSIESQSINLFVAIGVMLIVSSCISLFVSYRQIIKNFDTNKSKISLQES